MFSYPLVLLPPKDGESHAVFLVYCKLDGRVRAESENTDCSRFSLVFVLFGLCV